MKAILVATLSLVLCGGRSEAQVRVHLIVPAPSYAVGDTAELRLANGSGTDIGYNLCFAQLQERRADDWAVVRDTRACRSDLHLLSPGDTVAGRYPLPHSLVSGTYRFVASVEGVGGILGAAHKLVSNEFQITAPPPPD